MKKNKSGFTLIELIIGFTIAAIIIISFVVFFNQSIMGTNEVLVKNELTSQARSFLDIVDKDMRSVSNDSIKVYSDNAAATEVSFSNAADVEGKVLKINISGIDYWFGNNGGNVLFKSTSVSPWPADPSSPSSVNFVNNINTSDPSGGFKITMQKYNAGDEYRTYKIEVHLSKTYNSGKIAKVDLEIKCVKSIEPIP
jgi:type II secretory pathway pseudopilin PulG